MLKRLTITNLAILTNIDLYFKDGFTVLTGETGAGKSLIIDSLSLLLGERASSELIRQGEEKAIIRGEFCLDTAKLKAQLIKLKIPLDGDNIVIERVISKNKSTIKINNTAINLNDLILIAPLFADIHSQFDYAKLLNKENYLDIIDNFATDLISSYKNEYVNALTKYRNVKNEYNSLLLKEQKFNENRDFYLYQYKELSSMNLLPNEDEQINSKILLLNNYDKIYSLQQQIIEIIDGNFLDNFYDLNAALKKLSSLQEAYKEKGQIIDERYYEIVDLLNEIKKDFKETDYDPNSLDELNQRDSDLSMLKRKYKKTLSELITYRDELASSINNESTIKDTIDSKKEELDNAFANVITKGKDLSSVRKQVAKKIEKELENSLRDLLLNVKFEITFSPVSFDDDSLLLENGIDIVDFYIETNIGEGLKSLSKVVSGGEASRIMLALKALYIKTKQIPTIIFDEIDTGISGETAIAMAKKIREISLYSQVIAITHTPQVASISDHHILIGKEIKNNRTYAYTKELNLNEKIEQIAYLISGDKVTEKQLEYAKEMVLTNR